MIRIEDIFFRVGAIINEAIRLEFEAQGHSLTGEFARSLKTKMDINSRTATLSGTSVKYAQILEEGLKPEEINDRMLPGLINYFQLRGLPQVKAEQAARATLSVWKKEGMSTKASGRYSSTGERHHFIRRAFEKINIDSLMLNLMDEGIEQEFRKTKSETI